jgi:hypothetical protein
MAVSFAVNDRFVHRNESLEVLVTPDFMRDSTTQVRLELVEVAHLVEVSVGGAWRSFSLWKGRGSLYAGVSTTHACILSG